MEKTSAPDRKAWHRWLGGAVGATGAAANFASALESGQVSYLIGGAGFVLAAVGWYMQPPEFEQSLFRKYRQLIEHGDAQAFQGAPNVIASCGLFTVLASVLLRWLS